MTDEAAAPKPPLLSFQEVLKFLPHRAPFLLIDRVLRVESPVDLRGKEVVPMAGIKVVAQKNITYNEPFFAGHFPNQPIVPGVLLVEMMAQASCFSLHPFIREGEKPGKFQCFLVGVNQARFRHPVVPGDVLIIETEVTKGRGKMWVFEGKVKVDGRVVAEAEIMANLLSGEATGIV